MRQINHFIVGGASGSASLGHQIWNPSTVEVEAEVALGEAAVAGTTAVPAAPASAAFIARRRVLDGRSARSLMQAP